MTRTRLRAAVAAVAAAAAVTFTAAPADARHSPTGVIHTRQAVWQDVNALHATVSWATDENAGAIDVTEVMQRRRTHRALFIVWHDWVTAGRRYGQHTTRATHGHFNGWVYCQRGVWRAHVDTTTTLINHGLVSSLVIVRHAHNSPTLTVKSC